MMLGAWPQAAASGELQFWLGLFGTETPPAPAFRIGDQDVQPLAPVVWHRIRDQRHGPGGQPLNHQAVARLPAAGADRLHRVTITVAGAAPLERVVHTWPATVPAKMDGSFNLLVSSCYFQPEDGGGLLARVISQLPRRPHLTMLAGDQVYVDLPLFEDVPEEEPALSQFIAEKYRKNWLSQQLGTAGLEPVLASAPTVCIPDDHEFWNNYPFPQAQLPGTWKKKHRTAWTAAAQALYEDYQHGGAPGSAPPFHRIDVAPLSILLVDTRCGRDGDLDLLMTPAAEAAVQAWAQDLIASDGGIGVLGSGQALFIDKPGDLAARMKDAEYANYKQFSVIEDTIAKLADHGIPVVYITGDVHWGRVCEAVHKPSGRPLLWEVICSPSRLIQTPGADQRALFADRVRGVFGNRQAWPRHSEPPDPPTRFGRLHQFGPTRRYGRRGDQVALLSFRRAGRGVEMEVTFHPVHADPAIARPDTVGPFSLLPL
jgi:hypothetical protein